MLEGQVLPLHMEKRSKLFFDPERLSGLSLPISTVDSPENDLNGLLVSRPRQDAGQSGVETPFD